MGADVSATSVATVLRDHDVSVASGVPTVWYDVCEAVRRDPTLRPASLREVLSGGSVVPPSVIRSIAEILGARVVTAWGMTETMSCSTYEREEPSGFAGLPIPLVETRIVSSDSRATGPGVRGRLEVRGPFVVGAVSAQDEDGWMDTGDVASVDERGRLHLHDRQKDLIKSGGEWIVSAEIEQHLCSHPSVSVAAVVARPDARWMERPVAFVIRSREPFSEQTTAGEMRTHLAAIFPRWWLPDVITITESLPVTAVGKIDKVALRRAEQAEAIQTHDIQTHQNAQPINTRAR